MTGVQLVWFRNDLRTHDHTALAGATRQACVAGDLAAGCAVLGVYCFCPHQFQMHDVGANRVAFTLLHLRALARELSKLGMVLRIIEVLDFAAVPDALAELAQVLGARRLWFNEEYPLNERRRDQAVEARFVSLGIPVMRCTDAVIQAPGSVCKANGQPYTMFTPFRKRWLALFDPAGVRPQARPVRQAPSHLHTDAVPALPRQFTVTANLDAWPVGEAAARARLDAFTSERLGRYDRDRDFPALAGTSALSPYLSLGVLSVRTCLEAALAVNHGHLDEGEEGVVSWINELIWREFYRHIVVAFPYVCRGHAFRREYDDFPWRDDPAALTAWEQGRTGYPLIDAAMRQLVTTGWMHNRLRMLTAMFLSKNLLLDWRSGERFFMHHLLDGDFAANNGGWQWSGSTGTDAAPYFRIFSPIRQSERFDPEGRFIRSWIPGLGALPDRALHDPACRGAVKDYPAPIVDAMSSRRRAIDTFRAYATD